jgi:hypothetical protein
MPTPRFTRSRHARTVARPTPKRVHVVYDIETRDVLAVTCDDAAAIHAALPDADHRQVITLDVAQLRTAIAAERGAVAWQ